MDKTIIFKTSHQSIRYNPVFGKGDTVPIDQQPVCSFNIDPATGCPMSDITAIVRAKGLDRERLLANLEEFRAEFLPSEMTNEQALKFMNPRLCQLPSELAEFAEFAAFKQLEEEKAKQEAKDLEVFKNSLKERETKKEDGVEPKDS